MTLSDIASSPSVDQLRADLISLVDQYAAATGSSDSAISRSVFPDSGFIKKLRSGASFTLASGERLERWLRAELKTIAGAAPQS